jgi:hypothetical protein
VGQRHNQMDKLPEAVERAQTRWSEELAVHLQVHDRVRGLTLRSHQFAVAVQFCVLQFINRTAVPRFSEQEALVCHHRFDGIRKSRKLACARYMEFQMKLVLGVSVALLLFGSAVWASLSVGSLSQNTGAWVSHSR